MGTVPTLEVVPHYLANCIREKHEIIDTFHNSQGLIKCVFTRVSYVLVSISLFVPSALCQTQSPTPPQNTPGLNTAPITARPFNPVPMPQSLALRGFVDLHTHPLANLAFGGKLVYGGPDIGALLPADPNCQHNVRATSEQQALGHDNSTHGGWGLDNTCGDDIRVNIIHALQQQLNANDPPDDASGYPDFPNWPMWKDITHQRMWVEWIRRAYTGGLRVMVALATNNKTLGDMTAGPGDGPTDDKASGDLQISEIKRFVLHSDFMEIASSSADVNRIVSANKLAVVVGVELDHIGNLQVAQSPGVPALAAPSDADVRAEIDRLFNEGVRYIFPIHLLDNAFGGTAAYESLFDVSNLRESGHPYALVCAAATDGIADTANGGFTYDNSGLGFETIVAQLLKTGFAVDSISAPQCPSGIGQKNALGLTPSGIVAIKEMMRLGMLIDIDHMSQAAADQTLQLASSFGYPVNSGHNGVRDAVPTNRNERALRADQYALIGKLHGMAGVGGAGLPADQWLALYQNVIQAMGGNGIVAGFGTDTNGLAFGMAPRAGAAGTQPTKAPGPQYEQYEACLRGPKCSCNPIVITGGVKPVSGGCISSCEGQCLAQFPNAFVTVPGHPDAVQYAGSFPASSDGSRTWNYNQEGVVHYGMLWDFIQDLRSLPGGSAVVDNSLMAGADYFFHTWQLAETRASNVK